MRIVGQIESLVRQDNAGFLNKELLEYFEWRLLEIWRDEERRREREFQIYTKSLFEVLAAKRM